MASKTQVLPPLSETDREQLLAWLQSEPEPLTAAQIAKLPFASRKVTAQEAADLLKECVALGQLAEWPPKTAKGQPRYWNQDLNSVAQAAIRDAVQNAAVPVTVKDLLKQLKAPVKLTEGDLTPILPSLLSAGVIHSIPPSTPRGKARYWSRDELEYGKLNVIEVLRSHGPQTEVNLKKKVKWLSADQFRHVVNGLFSSSRLHRHPPLGKVKQELYGLQPPQPALYLKDLETALIQRVALLQAAHVSHAELRRALVQLVEAAGVSFGAVDTHSSAGSNGDRTQPVDLLALMQRIEPGAARGALVGTRDLRRAARLGKATFDRAIIDLAREQRLSLHRHDFASSLDPTERDELVTDGQGNFYVGVAIRNFSG